MSTLLYGSEAWATYGKQEQKLNNSLHMRCLRRKMGIHWYDEVTNSEELQSADIDSIYALLMQRRMRWLGHVRRMENRRTPKDVLYGELAVEILSTGSLRLRFEGVCKRDLKAVHIDVSTRETLADDRVRRRQATIQGAATSGNARVLNAAEKRAGRHKKNK